MFMIMNRLHDKKGFTIVELLIAMGLSTMVILFASLMGTLVPVIFKRLGIDPAVSSGPFVTMVNDLSGILIYLSISSAFMKYIAR